jgi:outer membrane protein
VRKLKAQCEPTLDLVASLGRTSQGAGSTPNQSGYKNNLRTIGLQLNVPLYSGGETASKVAEAILLESKARHELDAAKRQALSQAGQAWAQLRAAQAKLEVSEIALTAAQSAERLAKAGIRAGTKTLLDELQAKKQVESAIRDAKRAYYDNVIGMSKLMAATGLIEEDTLRDIQERLKNPLPFAKIPGIEFSAPEN